MIAKLDMGMAFRSAAKNFFYWMSALFIYALVVYGLLIVPTPDIKTTAEIQLTHPADTLSEQLAQYVTVPEGGVSWHLFSKTKVIDYRYTNMEGDQQNGVRPEFSQELKNLDGQEIILQGYVFPIEASENQTRFLFEPFPMSCPFQSEVGMEMIIYVQAAEKIPFGWGPITLKGKLELIPRDDKYNFFYRLNEARQVK